MQRAGAVTVSRSQLLFRGISSGMNRAIFLNAAGMASQAADLSRAFESPVSLSIVTGGHIPFVLRFVPGDGRFVQKPIDLNQIGSREVARTDQIADWKIQVCDFFSLGRPHDFFVMKLPILPVDSIGSAGCDVIGRLHPEALARCSHH